MWYTISLVLFVLSSEQQAQVLNRTITATNKNSVEFENLTKEHENMIQEINKINEQKSNISKEIEHLKQSCDEDVHKLNNEQLTLQNNLNEIQKNMVNMLKVIEEEEAYQARLKANLKEILEVLNMYENQYEIIFYDLKLMEFRRENGTAYRCNEVSKSLKEEFDEVLVTRGYLVKTHRPRVSKLTDQEMKLRILKTEVGIKDMLRRKLSTSLESLNVKYNILLDECEARKSSIRNLIIDTKRILDMSSNSVTSMRDDLKSAIDYTEAISIEIQTANGLIEELKQKISKMKIVVASYNDDEVCYKYLKSVE